MAKVRNPILPGFHPDPSICLVDGWYYIASSTFEWWPGVRIHRSRDLAHWELAGYALTRRSQLDMRGNPDSGGIWAPCLSFSDGLFWLAYTDAKSLHGPFKDVRNFLVTSPSIEGPWSEPVLLNASGFDPSLFHDTDGRKWLVSMSWKVRPDLSAFAGILLQEYDPAARRLVGRPANIFRGSPLGITEGPHVYKKDGYYWLVTAEGGTGWEHAVTVARSRDLAGPYEIAPGNPLLSSAGHPELVLQKAGHASFVQAPDGRWYLAHLCSRVSGPRRRCILGRETALQAVDWPEGGWPRLAQGGRLPAEFVEIPSLAGGAASYLTAFHDHFDRSELDGQWNSLREPLVAPWLSLTERPGFLRLRGRHSLQSAFDQSTLGIRLMHPHCRVSTRLDFSPVGYHQQAGLAMYYNTYNFYYLYLSADEEGRRELRLLACDNRRYREVLEAPVPVPEGAELVLEAELDGEDLRFRARIGGREQTLGPVLDATILSDDYPSEAGLTWAFTGAFAVLCAQDASDSGIPADFDWFDYQSLQDFHNPHHP
jgi:xylan 1,4-beta-xylosidase